MIVEEPYGASQQHQQWNRTELSKLGWLTSQERQALQDKRIFKVGTTDYYLGLINRNDINDPIRKTILPDLRELKVSTVEEEDSLGEETHRQNGCVIHRYPDRVLFLATHACASYCRYCTRSRIVGTQYDRAALRNEWDTGIDYIASHPEIRDVLISGGDPLTMPIGDLDMILERIRKIGHVKIIRIGTKLPMVQPQAITPAMVEMLKRHHPLFLSVHATHPREINVFSTEALGRIADAGIPMGSQTVLLKGVNDSVETLTELFYGLLGARVRPYYLYQCDMVSGTSHFRTSVTKGLKLMQGLRGFISGYAIPHYVIDAPKGGGKIPILPNYLQSCEDGKVTLKNYLGNTHIYHDGQD